jgi:hypothetical protein
VAAQTPTRFLAVSIATLLAACVYVPRTTQVYDFECRTMANHMVLEGGQVAAIAHCENQGCIALIVGAGVVTAATVIVSGSIVVVGNIAYWFERKARCQSVP